MKRIHSILILCMLSMLWPQISASRQEISQAVSADTFSTPHFWFSYESGIAVENIRGIADDMELIFGDFNAKAMMSLSKEIPTVVGTSFANLMRRTSERIQSPVVYLRDTLFIVSWIDAGIARERVLPLLRYAIAFAIVDRGATLGTPSWLVKGYALRYSNIEMSLTPPPIAYLRSFEDFGEEEQLASSPGISGDYQYLLLKTIDYLINRYGEEKFVSLFTLLRSDRSVEEGFEKAFGEKYSVIEKAWRSYIDTQVGKSVKQKGNEPKQKEK